MRKRILATCVALGLGGGYLAVDTLYGPPDDPLLHMLEVFDRTCMAYADARPKPISAPSGFQLFDPKVFRPRNTSSEGYFLHNTSGLLLNLKQHNCTLKYKTTPQLPPVQEMAWFRNKIQERATKLSPKLKLQDNAGSSQSIGDVLALGEFGTKERWGISLFMWQSPSQSLTLTLRYKP
jgi:hypothetical protein